MPHPLLSGFYDWGSALNYRPVGEQNVTGKNRLQFSNLFVTKTELTRHEWRLQKSHLLKSVKQRNVYVPAHLKLFKTTYVV